MANHEKGYFLLEVPVDPEGTNQRPFLQDVLIRGGFPGAQVRPMDPADLPQKVLIPEDPVFKSFFDRMIEDTDLEIHPVIHALKEGLGKANIRDILRRGDGVGLGAIKAALNHHVLKGHIFRDQEDPMVLICPHFLPAKYEESSGDPVPDL